MLDVWLMVVMCAWLFDIALSAILNVARFDLGFYLGRIYGLCAASFVLAVLLVDNVGLQAKLAGLLAALRREAASERTLRTERDSLFSAVVKSSNDAIVTKLLDGTITGWNGAAERLFGFTAAEAVGKSIDIIVPPERRTEVRDILERAGRGEQIEHYETSARAQGWTRRRGLAEHIPDPVGLRRDHRRFQDGARHHRTQDRRCRRSTRRSRSAGGYSTLPTTSSWSPTPAAILSRSARASPPSSAISPPT